jgi:ABC-type multidrug transport system fused ATPase/permease subunit
MILSNIFGQDVFTRSFNLLNKQDKFKYKILIFAQACTSLLDLFGIILLYIFTSIITMNSISSTKPSLISTLDRDLIKAFPNTQALYAFLGIMIATFFILKSIFSLQMIRKIFLFLALSANKLVNNLISEFFKRSLPFALVNNSQETIYSLNTGVNSAVTDILGNFSIVFSEFGLLAILLTFLFLYNPYISILVLVYFLCILIFIQKKISKIVVISGRKRADADIKIAQQIQETIQTFREIYVVQKFDYFVGKINETRFGATKFIVDSQWAVNFPKYFLESTVVFATAMIGFLEFGVSKSSGALTIMTIFMATTSRILPSILRIQGAVNGIKASSGAAKYTFDLIERLNLTRNVTISKSVAQLKSGSSGQSLNHEFKGYISFDRVNFSHSASGPVILKDVSFQVIPGTSLGIIGESGSGKSTILDLMLGIIAPTSGSIRINDVEPKSTIESWPGCIGYVPQNVSILSGTLRENILLSESNDTSDDASILEILGQCELMPWYTNLPFGLNTLLLENGSNLSGGQRQRIGLARALFSNPKLLILDEVTSALDADTEEKILLLLNSLPNEITKVIVSHRLSALQVVNQVITLENGLVKQVKNEQN